MSGDVPAFPCVEEGVTEYSRQPLMIHHPGMTLRDYFAGTGSIQQLHARQRK